MAAVGTYRLSGGYRLRQADHLTGPNSLTDSHSRLTEHVTVGMRQSPGQFTWLAQAD